MVDKVKPLKMESASTGGTQDDMFPTELNPAQDYSSAKGISFEGSDTRLIDLDGSGNMQFLDAGQTPAFRLNRLVKDFGTIANSLTASVQATANITKTLLLADHTIQIFTGTVAGQILKLPNATTLGLGHLFECWNLSTQNITVRDNGNNTLATIGPNGRTQIILYNNSTSNGLWSLTYTLDNGNVFGAVLHYQDSDSEQSTNSKVTWVNKINLVTGALPAGDYMIQYQFIWRAGANRNLDIRIQNNGVNVSTWNPWVNNVNERQLVSGFRREDGLSGVKTFTLDFRVGPASSTTVFVSFARLFVWRVA